MNSVLLIQASSHGLRNQVVNLGGPNMVEATVMRLDFTPSGIFGTCEDRPVFHVGGRRWEGESSAVYERMVAME